MAGEWLKFECSLPEKPETLAITIAMGWDDPDLTVGKLMRLFRWFDQQTIDGNAKAVTPALLDRIIGTNGFASAVAKVGWLVISDEGLALNNFDKHNGHSAKSRSETAKRVANHRAKKSDQTDDPEDGTYQRLCIPRPIRAAVMARDGNACVYCKRKEGEYGLGETKRDGVLCLDHVIPLAQGGTDDVKNFVTACTPCNLFKSDRTPDECGLAWPEVNGERLGNAKPVTTALPREEKRREESSSLRSEEKSRRSAPLAKPEDVSEQVWTDWLQLRKGKKAAVTETVLSQARSEAEKAHLSLNDFLSVWCARGSQGLQADWLKLHERGSPQASGETAYQRSMRERMQQIVPGVAARSPALNNIIEMEVAHVATRRLDR